MSAFPVIARSNLRLKPLAACLLLPLMTGQFVCTSVAAATPLQVTNCNDAGSGSLREALAIAHSGDNVDLTTLRCGMISLSTGELLVPVDDLALQGPGADALTIAGSQVYHRNSVLHHTGHGTLRVDALRITDSHAEFSPFHELASRCIESTGTVDLNRSTVTQCTGGGVFANGFSSHDSTISDSYQGVFTTGGNVSINSSTISGNTSYVQCVGLLLGPPTLPAATALISNSTISGNYSFFNGSSNPYYSAGDASSAGCIYQPVTISNSTVAFNRSRSSTGALLILVPDITIESSIFAHNSRRDLDIPSDMHVNGHNNVIMSTGNTVPADTIVADPLLLPLANNGGPTRTHALAAGSPAIDTGNNSRGLGSDQRGPPFVRSAGARPDIGAFELQSVPAASGSIDPSFTGSWFDPAQDGHGLMLEVLPDNHLLALWFAFDPAGDEQAWFGGVGTYSGDTATITDAALPTGGRWIPNFDPNMIVRKPWGTLTLKFTDHDHGKVEFDSALGYGSGNMNLLRLTNVAAQSALGNGGAVAPSPTAVGPAFTGSWFDPAQSGHGLMLEVLPDNRLLALWFAFNPAGDQQAWFGGVGTYSGDTATITDVAQPTGGRWIPNFDPNTVVRNPWGTLTFTFTDCNHGKVDFSSVRGYGNGNMNLTRLTLPAGLSCP